MGNFFDADRLLGSNDPPSPTPEESNLSTRQLSILRALEPGTRARSRAVGRRALLTNPGGELGIQTGGRARILGGG